MVKGIDGLLTIREAAAYVGLSEKTVKWYISHGRRSEGKNRSTKGALGKLVPDARIGGAPLFSRDTLDEYFGLYEGVLDAAKKLGIPKSTFQKMMRNGEVIKTPHGISRTELERLASTRQSADQSQDSASETGGT